MPLARLENLLKNLNGNIIYVDPAQLDSTDSVQNRGNSALRPFKTIQRALLEAVRFSYVQGANNDLFDQTTILISPGTHFIDNRPGIYVDGNTAKTYGGVTTTIPELNIQSNFDITDSANELYKFNSADGGVIIPRGVSIVASDLRKTKIRPKYVPNPTDDLAPATSIFKVTGASYIFGFSIFDGDPNGNVFSNPNSVNQVPPSYSHHKLTVFEYADGNNKYVKNGVKLDKTDLEMYYYKVAKAFGVNSGVPSIIDWGVSSSPDLYPNIEENRIVGDLGKGSILIDDIIAGNGVDLPSNIVTVTTKTEHGLSPLTSILVTNVGANAEQRAEYNGSFTVAQVISSTQFTYRLSDSPNSTLNPTVNSNSNISTVSDTVSSSSPYVFNCSLKSVYGMNGLHADGSKATGFKSIVTAQFTGISLQKDDRAFVLYNENSGTYNEQESFSDRFLHQDPNALYKPSWESFHIKASNDAFIQCVSIFAIGYAKQFVADNGGDQSITNSNSNFGAIALTARGFKDYQLDKDNYGFITHIIPPKEITDEESDIRCLKIDSTKTVTLASSNSNTRVYLKGYDNQLDPPPNKFRNYSIGGRLNDKIYIDNGAVSIAATVSPNYKLELDVLSINSNTITLSQSVSVGTVSGINTSQAVRVVSNDATLPDGLEANKLYYINTSTLVGSATTTLIKLSENISNSLSSTSVVSIKNTIGVTSGNLKIVSKVSDRSSGDVASPIQFDSVNNAWYVSIQQNSSFITTLNSVPDPVFYVKRIIDSRSTEDRIYRARIVIPKESANASEPSVGFVIQKSSTSLASAYTNPSTVLSSVQEAKNRNQIVDAWVISGTPNECHIITKNPHNLKVGNLVNIYDLQSSNEPNLVGLGTGTGYNGSHYITSVVDDAHFVFETSYDPGTIETVGGSASTWLNVKNCSSTVYRVPPYTIGSPRTNLPYFTCESVNNDYQIYKLETIQKFSHGVSDGVYNATLNTFKNKPSVAPFNIENLKLSQSIENLYPNSDIDNPNSDPAPTKTKASRKTIGKIDINDPENSVTKETISEFFKDFSIGAEVASISKSGSTCILTTTQNHGLKGIRQLSSVQAGTGFVPGTWYDIPLCGGTGQNATAVVTVDSGGTVTSALISNPGSGYESGQTLTIRGIPHSSISGSSVTVSIGSIFNGTLNSIQIIGSKNKSNDGFFPIDLVSRNTITYVNANGVTELDSGASVIFSGERLTVSSASGTTNTTIVVNSRHSISVGNKVYFSAIPSQNFNVISVPSPTSFVVDGDATLINSSNDKSVFIVEFSPSLRNTNSTLENLSSRQYALNSGVSIRTSNSDLGDIDVTTTEFSVGNAYGFDKGDFIQIDDEIMMLTSVSASTFTVIRGLFNTKAATHVRNTLVKKITPVPIELRRNSILRASGHTFEYLGFGPGNYSTGMPTNQTRILTDDEVLISQALSTRGGSVLYTGMNSNGEYFIGRKKFNTLTGQEELLGVPPVESGPQTSVDELTITELTVTKLLDASTAGVNLGNTIINGTLEVTGTSTFKSNVNSDGNVTVSVGSSFIGNGTIPIGGIIMWSGATVPVGWATCNGSNGTPDLRDKFIIGVGPSHSLNTTGGNGTTTLNQVSYVSDQYTSTSATTVNETFKLFDGASGALSPVQIVGLVTLTPNNSGPSAPTETGFDLVAAATPTVGVAYTVHYNNAPIPPAQVSIERVNGGILRFNDNLSDSDFNDIIIEAKQGYFYKGAGDVVYYRVGVTSLAQGNASYSNEPPYYALAYIMRIA